MILNSSKLELCFFFSFDKLILFEILDARFNKGLIENCQADINRHCRSEIVDDDDDDDKDDDDKDTNDDDVKGK